MAKRKEIRAHQSFELQYEQISGVCGVAYAIDILAGRWKLYILYKLVNRTLRFGELKEHIPNSHR